MNDNYYKTRLSYSKKRDAIWKHICNYIQKYINYESSILDLGAGYCSFINNINVKHKFAADHSSDFTKYANDNIKTIVTKCNKLNAFKDKQFDVVFTSNLFEHITKEELSQTLEDITRILKKNGKLIILQPNFKYCYKNYFDDYTHKEIYTDISLKDILLNHNFSIIKIESKFVPFSMKSTLGFFSFLTPFYLYSPIKPFAGQMLIIAQKKE